MNNIFKILSGFVFCIVLASCSKDDNTTPYVTRDEKEQRKADMDSIDKFLNDYHMNVTADFDVTFNKKLNGELSIKDQTDYPLKDTIISQKLRNGTNDTIQYKIYYIKFREGSQLRPTQADSIHIAYRGVSIENEQFDIAQTPVWFQLQNLISGWSHIIPNFHTGEYIPGTGGNPSTYQNYGAGVMFLPSGLGYFDSSAGSLLSYSPLIFNFKLMDLQYMDQDRDGIKSKDERKLDTSIPAELRWKENPFFGSPTYKIVDGKVVLYEVFDTDGDGIPNMKDDDDDGDHFTTRSETQKRPEDITSTASLGHYPFDPTTTEPKGVPNCGNTDFTSPTRLRKYLDKNCHYEP